MPDGGQKSSRWISQYVASHQRQNHHHSCHLESWFRDNAHLPRPSHYPPTLRVRAKLLCPKCGNWWEHGGLLPGIEFAAVEVKEGDSDSFCNLCEEKVTAKRLLQDSASEMQFISVTNSSGKIISTCDAAISPDSAKMSRKPSQGVSQHEERRAISQDC
jgi:hypothetical protein